MSNRLYIIGNGFDLHHGLLTHYGDFAKYLRRNNPELYHTLESYISYPTPTKPNEDLWSRFEENLANLNVDDILSEHSGELPDYASDDFRDRDRYVFPDTMERYCEQLTTGLFDEFRDFILSVNYPQSAGDYKISLDNSALFLTFNYTNTLERLYGIAPQRILYIHNSAYTGDEIILGHGIDPKNFEDDLPEPPPEIATREELEKWYQQHENYEYSYDSGRAALMKYFSITYKPTQNVIATKKQFFKGLITIEEVFVLGHAISSVDLPYFVRIIKSVNQSAKWSVTFYGDDEKVHHLNALVNLGVDRSCIKLFELDELQEANKQLKIQF